MSTDEKDMGPFAGMDPKLAAAITRYGTPPYRQIVRVAVRDVGSYSFEELPTSIDGWIAWLEAARQDTPAEYRGVLNCILSFERGWHDSGDSADLNVWYERPETDDEMAKRVGSGIAYVKTQDANERRQYEALKAKFGR